MVEIKRESRKLCDFFDYLAFVRKLFPNSIIHAGFPSDLLNPEI